jgi:hypothetical protein
MKHKEIDLLYKLSKENNINLTAEMKYVTIRAIRENDIGLLEKIVRGMTGIHKGFTVEPLNIVIFHEFSKKLRRYFLEISECQTDM